ncbi:hypothetical protein M413DRAFT_439942 [Hebeloma cylindrosporum]|uniref:Dihydrofolate reductase n=1 Tax=Hebeloma cylindrosporum TaxID=76867 RepID=A0A0C2Z4U7_HEBCY|nr:hypothetical protein M413DRAFT_439942 [Hebeloma cylindrosporum h7]
MSRLTIIVAATKVNGIGVNARLPWRLPKEMKYFAQVTTSAPEGSQNAVIMGRNTWESIPTKFRPLPKRTNIVISRNATYNLNTTDAQVLLKDNLKSALSVFDPSTHTGATNLHRGFIIGGATVYAESLALPMSSTEPIVDRVLLTRILSPEFNECDVFMPDFLTSEKTHWRKSTHSDLEEWVGFEVPEGEQEENGVKYEFQMWVREQ